MPINWRSPSSISTWIATALPREAGSDREGVEKEGCGKCIWGQRWCIGEHREADDRLTKATEPDLTSTRRGRP